MSVSNKASCSAYMGKSGSGKSTLIKRRIRKEKPSRLLIWSPDEDEDHYSEFGPVVRDIGSLVTHMAKPKFAVVFWPSMDPKRRAKEFDYFCRLAFASKNMTVLVEELRYVTSPSRSPEPWSMLNQRGRKKGIKVIGVSQRPAAIDKDFLGNTTEIYALAMKYPADRAAVAAAMPIDQIELDALVPLQWICVTDSGVKTTGKITF